MESNRIDYLKIFEAQLAEAPGPFKDCYAFSIHKAGSTLMHSMIASVCRAAQIPSITIPDVLFREGIFEKDWECDSSILSLVTPGRVYYGFRALPPLLTEESVRLREKKSVLLIRDPRDALVSQYYSFGGKHVSHRLPDKNKEAFVESAKITEDLTIDAYVLAAAPSYLNKMAAYRENLCFENVLLRRYEDIYYDKRKFLGEIFAHFGVEVSKEILDAVASRNDVRPASEDPGKHIRKGTPGDHIEKLQAETIQALNQIFRDMAACYGYDLK